MKRALALPALLSLSLVSLPSCAPKPPPAREPPRVPLHLEPACDLAPAAGVSWLVAARPRAIAEIPDLIPALGLVLSEERLRGFTTAHGGVDLRQVKDLCVAKYKDSLLAVAVVPLDPDRIASAFEARLIEPAKRTILAPNPRVLRLSGLVGEEPQSLVTFGRESVALEEGKSGPLRAAELLALEKLKRSPPALKGAALRGASDLLGDAPVQVFAAGPFDAETARGLGGLLRAATAVGASVRWTGSGAALSVRIVLMGAWGDDAPVAAERFAAAAHVLSESSIGRLFGLNRPNKAPSVRGEANALVLDAVIDGDALARGIHDAVDAEVSELMRR